MDQFSSTTHFSAQGATPFTSKITDPSKLLTGELSTLKEKMTHLQQVSGHSVSAAMIGSHGTTYLGVNVEVPGSAYADNIHAEGFALIQAVMNDEPVSKVVSSTTPCSHCRALLLELGDPNQLKVVAPEGQNAHTNAGAKPYEKMLAEINPFLFKADDSLGTLFNPKTQDLASDYQPLAPTHVNDNLAIQAYTEATQSFTPYADKAWAGIAVEYEDDQHNKKTYLGRVLGSSAYNPSILPFHVAMVQMIADGHSLEDIGKNVKRVVYVDPADAKVSHLAQCQNLLNVLRRNVGIEEALPFEHIQLEPKQSA